MRKIFPIIVAVLLVVWTTIPAFAFSDVNDAVFVYSSMPFERYWCAGSGNVTEWPFSFSKIGTDGNLNSDGRNAWVSCTKDKGIYGTFEVGVSYREADTGYIYLNLAASDVMINPNLPFYIRGNTGVLIQKVLVTGSYYVPYYDKNAAEMQMKYINFARSFDFSQNNEMTESETWVGLHNCLNEAIYVNDYAWDYSDDGLYFIQDIQISLIFTTYNVNSTRAVFYVQNPYSSLYTSERSPAIWWNQLVAEYDLPELPNNLNILSFIESSVDGFLSRPIIGNYPLSSIVGICVGIGLLLWFIKLLR